MHSGFWEAIVQTGSERQRDVRPGLLWGQEERDMDIALLNSLGTGRSRPCNEGSSPWRQTTSSDEFALLTT